MENDLRRLVIVAVWRAPPLAEALTRPPHHDGHDPGTAALGPISQRSLRPASTSWASVYTASSCPTRSALTSAKSTRAYHPDNHQKRVCPVPHPHRHVTLPTSESSYPGMIGANILVQPSDNGIERLPLHLDCASRNTVDLLCHLNVTPTLVVAEIVPDIFRARHNGPHITHCEVGHA